MPLVHIAMTFRLADHYRAPRHWPHGTPVPIVSVPGCADLVDAHEVQRAAALVQQEASTLDEKESVGLRTQLDELCYTIQVRCFGDAEDTLVWYHPDTQDFWAYPGASL